MMEKPGPQFFDAIYEELVCPLSQELMKDPVTIQSGHTYERSLIQSWFDRGNRTNPITGLPLNSIVLYQNMSLKNLIEKLPTNKQKIDKTNNTNNSLLVNINLFNENIKMKDVLNSKQIQINEMKKQLEEKSPKVKSYEKEINLLVQTLLENSQEIQLMKAEIQNLNQLLKVSTNEKQVLKKQINQQKSQNNEKNQYENTMKHANEEINRLNNLLRQKKQQIKQNRDKMIQNQNKMVNRINQYQSRIKNLVNQLLSLRTKCSEFQDLQNRYKASQKKIVQYESSKQMFDRSLEKQRKLQKQNITLNTSLSNCLLKIELLGKQLQRLNMLLISKIQEIQNLKEQIKKLENQKQKKFHKPSRKIFEMNTEQQNSILRITKEFQNHILIYKKKVDQLTQQNERLQQLNQSLMNPENNF